MRLIVLTVFLPLLLSCCALAPGWHGPDVHLVDGVWIGAESPCRNDSDDLACRSVVAMAIELLEPGVRARVTSAVVAELPTEFVTEDGETRSVRTTAGIMTQKVVVIDLADRSRRVVGLWCYLPFASGGGLLVGDASCDLSSIDTWRDGIVPPPMPPDAQFGRAPGL